MISERDHMNGPPLRPAKRPANDNASLLGSHAFLGSAVLPIANGAVYVHALCWPIVSTGWRSMAQTWDSVREWRHAPDSNAKPHAPSWVAECAPQLGMPFHGTTAEESSIAAIFTRTPMCVAVSVFDGDVAQAKIRAHRRDGLLECLSIYNEYLRAPGRQPCSVLVTRSDMGAADQGYIDAFARSQRSLDVKWLQDMELRVPTNPREPLPLEVAHVVAASVARYRVDEGLDNPIVDAVRPKLSRKPALLDRPPRKRR